MEKVKEMRNDLSRKSEQTLLLKGHYQHNVPSDFRHWRTTLITMQSNMVYSNLIWEVLKTNKSNNVLKEKRKIVPYLFLTAFKIW